MKRELKVGDRVRVYGWVQMHHPPYIPRYGGKGIVVWRIEKEIHIKFDKASNGTLGEDQNHYSVDPKQCRYLKRAPTTFQYLSRLVFAYEKVLELQKNQSSDKFFIAKQGLDELYNAARKHVLKPIKGKKQ